MKPSSSNDEKQVDLFGAAADNADTAAAKPAARKRTKKVVADEPVAEEVAPVKKAAVKKTVTKKAAAEKAATDVAAPVAAAAVAEAAPLVKLLRRRSARPAPRSRRLMLLRNPRPSSPLLLSLPLLRQKRRKSLLLSAKK